MRKYAFVLGSHPLISFLEILNILNVEKIPHEKPFRIGEEILLIKMKIPEAKLKKLQNILGGTIKIIEIMDEFSGTIFNLDKLLDEQHLTKDYFAQTDTKINFGFSVYSQKSLVYAEINWLRNFAFQLKRRLKTKYSVRYVDEKNFELSSVMVANNKLVETGAEIIIIKQDKDFIVGRTRTVQDFRSYVQRDMEKPSPNPKSGMLPPKLAQMIINLSRNAGQTQVFDPFCGSGVLLQEGLLLGLEILGSDIDEEAVEATQENLKWLLKTFNTAAPKIGRDKIKATSIQGRTRAADATRSRWQKANQTNVFIATEPYLGPPQRSIPLIHHARKTAQDLEKLYLGFFENLAKNYSKIKNVGIVFPVLKTNEGLLYLNILDEVEKMGYKRREFLPKEEAKKEALSSPRGGLLYSRPDQYVLREIFVFDKR
ncbi:MAG: DNA methyltransferase [Patescibacteria group bacterium]|nr:DNA methyltransferase [Patescibacteria group bacterium]